MTASRTHHRAIKLCRSMAALLGTLGLVACGSGADGGVLSGGAGSKWTNDDACKTLDKASVAAATGQSVTKAEGSGNQASAGTGAAVSTCTYSLTNGTVVLLTRVSEDDMTDAEIEQMRDAGGMMPKGVDLPGFGMKAFWTEESRQIQVIADRKHYFSIAYGPTIKIPGQAPVAEGNPKAVVTQLARKLL